MKKIFNWLFDLILDHFNVVIILIVIAMGIIGYYIEEKDLLSHIPDVVMKPIAIVGIAFGIIYFIIFFFSFLISGDDR